MMNNNVVLIDFENNYIDDWHLYFFKIANLIAKKSKDVSSQVGTVIVKDKRILSTGFNGFCIGVKDFKERYLDRQTKLQLVAHSEFNACILAGRFGISLQESILYTQATPCDNCAKSIIQAGIKTVNILENCEKIWNNYQNWGESSKISKLMFQESGVKLNKFNLQCGDVIKIGGKIYDI